MKRVAIVYVAAGSTLWLGLLAATAWGQAGRLPQTPPDTLPPLRAQHVSSCDLVLLDGSNTTASRATLPVATSPAPAATPELPHQRISLPSDSEDEAAGWLWLCLAAVGGCLVLGIALAVAKRLWWAKLQQYWTDARQAHRRQRSLVLLQGIIQGDAHFQEQQWAAAAAAETPLPRATIPFVPREARMQAQHILLPLRKAA